MSDAREEQVAALVRDLETLHEAGGVGFWRADTTELTALNELHRVRGQPGGAATPSTRTRAVRAVLDEATTRLEPSLERKPARLLLGIDPDTSGISSRRGRLIAAAEAYGAHGVDESTYRRSGRLERTLRCVAGHLADHDARVGIRETELDHESPPHELVAGLRVLPALDGDALRPLAAGGLDRDLQTVLADLYHSARFVNAHQTFVSRESALRLRERAYDRGDWMYVLARRDLASPGFAQQEGWSDHVRWLAQHRHRDAPPPPIRRADGLADVDCDELGVNQIRVVIADEYDAAVDAARELRPVHRNGTLWWFPQVALRAYPRLAGLGYGMTLSTEHRYAMVSVPPTVRPPTVWVREPATFVSHCIDQLSSYDSASGDMRAIVTAAHDYVDKLRVEFRGLIQSELSRCIPSGAALEGALS